MRGRTGLVVLLLVVAACSGGEISEASTSVGSAVTSTVTTPITTPAPIQAAIEQLRVNGIAAELVDGVYVVPGTVNPEDGLLVEADLTTAADPIREMVVVSAELSEPALTVELPEGLSAVLRFTPGSGWGPAVTVTDPTGRTGEVTLAVEVFDLNGEDTIESLSVAQEFNFQHPDHADAVIEAAGLRPNSVEDAGFEVTAVSFADSRFDFIYAADKMVNEYISTNNLAPIDIKETEPGLYELSFHTKWPGRFPLHITATDADGNTTTTRTPVEIYWNQNPWEMRGAAIEFQFLEGIGDISFVSHLFDLAVDHNLNYIQLSPTWVMESPTSTGFVTCGEVEDLRGRCLSPSPEELRALIEEAHLSGLGVMLKPHVWATEFAPHDVVPADWDDWFANYSDRLRELAGLAEETGVEMLSIGNELQSSHAQDTHWQTVLDQVRAAYSGEVTYSDFTHWIGVGDGDSFPHESDLEYHGVPFYYPGIGTSRDLYLGLIEVYDDPTMEDMADNIERQVQQLLLPRMAESGNPAIATEFGRANNEGTSHDPWGAWWILGIDNQEQVDYFEAALRSASQHLEGIFFWSYAAWPDSSLAEGGLDLRNPSLGDLVAIWSR